jgi:hypothetical protein
MLHYDSDSRQASRAAWLKDRLSCVFRSDYNLPMLLPPSNSIFVPAWEPHISIYAHSKLALDFTSPG